MVTSVYVTATPVYRKIKELDDAVARITLENEMQKLGDIGIKAAQLKIKTDRGAPFSAVRKRFGTGGNGRVRSGKMLSSLGSRIEVGPKQMRIRVGWPIFQDYFGYQEEGFKQKWKFAFFDGKSTYGPNAPRGFVFKRRRGRPPKTKGMFALQDAKLAMINAKPAMIKKIKQMYGARFNK
jgi:hypothetical protein